MSKKGVPMYSGIRIINVKNGLDEFYDKEYVPIKEIIKDKLYQNENIVLKGDSSALGIVKGDKILKIQEKSIYGVFKRNKEQIFAINMLTDSKIQCVTLIGPAGTGKTLLAIAAGLEQSLGKDAKYTKMVYIKSLIPVGKELGYLPGDYADKVSPYMGAIYDCIDTYGDSEQKNKIKEKVGFTDRAKIQLMAAQFLRGRTLRKSYIVVDEAQNFTKHELRTILTRLDETSKIVILGDIDQSDIKHKINDEGLKKVVETFKDEKMFGHIDLIKSERSLFAELVAKKLK